MANLEARIAALEALRAKEMERDGDDGFGRFLDPDAESKDPRVIVSGRGQRWERGPGETARKFMERCRREIHSTERTGLGAFYERLLRVAA